MRAKGTLGGIKMEISVLVCTYNSSEKNISYTLDSIMAQKYEDYEVIIADDGSADNHEEFIKNYFLRHDFRRYKLRLSKTNVGTIRNIYEGAMIASGTYIKPIGAGDAFAHKSVLSNAVSFMKRENAMIMFTDMRLFSNTSQGIVFYQNTTIPHKMKPWKTPEKHEEILENIIVYNDQISGASMFYERKYLQNMMLILEKSVVYTEDLCQYIALLEGDTICYFPQCCILYECETGISTNPIASNKERIVKDKNNFMDEIFEKYGDNPYVKRRKKIEYIERTESKRYLKGIKKTLAEPRWLFFRLSYLINKI